MCGIIIPMRIQVRLSQASDIVKRSKITQVYINEVINIVNDDNTIYIVEKNPFVKPSRMVMILVGCLILTNVLFMLPITPSNPWGISPITTCA